MNRSISTVLRMRWSLHVLVVVSTVVLLLLCSTPATGFHSHATAIRINRPGDGGGSGSGSSNTLRLEPSRISNKKMTTTALTDHTVSPDLAAHHHHHHQDTKKWSQKLRQMPIRIVQSSKTKRKSLLLAAVSAISIFIAFTKLFATVGFMPMIGSLQQYFQQSYQKFLLDWKTYTFIPFVAAFVGWITNYLAVQMIFYPIQWRGIPIQKPKDGNPLGLLGWQGIIPAKTAKMSEAMVNVTISELLSMEETIRKLNPNHVADILTPQVPEMVKLVLEDNVTSAGIPPMIRNTAMRLIDTESMNNNNAGTTTTITSKLGRKVLQEWLGRNFLIKLTLDVQKDISNLFHVRNCVVNQMMSDRALLGQLFQKTGGKELKFLTDSGLWFGFLLGIFQMLFALLVCDNPWTLSFGGLLVGLATNWIALKWIFEPVEPTKIGPFVLQGKFLRRQKEVARDFSQFFASRILNSQEVWKSILYDPTTSPNFCKLFSNNLMELSTNSTKGLIGKNPKDQVFFTNAGTKIAQRLPYYFSQASFHSYVDTTLGIEDTLRTGLESMSSKKFEQILHPIFQEDELTLILAGGFLGFLAGFGQQLLAAGVWTLPSIASIVSVFQRMVFFFKPW